MELLNHQNAAYPSVPDMGAKGIHMTNFAGYDPQRTSDSQKLQTPKSAAQLAASSAEARSAEGPARRASMSAFVKHFLQP